MKREEAIEKIKNGSKLIQYSSFVKAGQSFSSPIKRGPNTIRYSLDGIQIHHKTGESIVKSGLVVKDSSTHARTLGGTSVEFKLKE